jgi:hypothetical protein
MRRLGEPGKRVVRWQEPRCLSLEGGESQRANQPRVTLDDADFRKSLMKMIYRKFPKTASLPVTWHHLEDNVEKGVFLHHLFGNLGYCVK